MPVLLGCWSWGRSVSIVARCGWRSNGIMSSLVWPSSVMMAWSPSATLMGSARNCFSLLTSLMTRSVIMSAPSCFTTFMRLRNAASSPVSCGILLHMLGSGFQLLQHPKKDAMTFAVSSPTPCVHPTNTVVASLLVRLGGHLMSLERLVDRVQLFRFSVTLVITWTGS